MLDEKFEEFVNELSDEYGVKKSTVLKYYEILISKYPFVLEDEDKFVDVMHEVISNVPVAESQFNTDDLGMTIKDKKARYAKEMLYKIDSTVNDFFDIEDSYYSR